MKVVQMTLDENLVKEVDRAVKKLGTSRSAFTRKALRKTLENMKQSDLEKKHRDGYLKKPATPDEFASWENEQVWID